jgi:hypothetical protein
VLLLLWLSTGLVIVVQRLLEGIGIVALVLSLVTLGRVLVRLLTLVIVILTVLPVPSRVGEPTGLALIVRLLALRIGERRATPVGRVLPSASVGVLCERVGVPVLVVGVHS